MVIAYGDRLSRFGLETMKKLFSGFGAEIEVINHGQRTPQQELVEDLITIISHKYKEVVEGAKKLISS